MNREKHDTHAHNRITSNNKKEILAFYHNIDPNKLMWTSGCMKYDTER